MPVMCINVLKFANNVTTASTDASKTVRLRPGEFRKRWAASTNALRNTNQIVPFPRPPIINNGSSMAISSTPSHFIGVHGPRQASKSSANASGKIGSCVVLT